jgi:hypothetical protein
VSSRARCALEPDRWSSRAGVSAAFGIWPFWAIPKGLRHSAQQPCCEARATLGSSIERTVNPTICKGCITASTDPFLPPCRGIDHRAEDRQGCIKPIQLRNNDGTRLLTLRVTTLGLPSQRVVSAAGKWSSFWRKMSKLQGQAFRLPGDSLRVGLCRPRAAGRGRLEIQTKVAYVHIRVAHQRHE